MPSILDFFKTKPKEVAATGGVLPTGPNPNRKSGVGTSIQAGVINDIDINANLRGEKWSGTSDKQGIARQMRNDHKVRQSLQYISAPLAGATWRHRAASDDPLDIEAAKFCDHVFIERLKWSGIIKSFTEEASADGYHLREMLTDWRKVPSRKFPGISGGEAIVPTDIVSIPANTITEWKQSKSDTAKLESVTQEINASDSEESKDQAISIKNIIRLTIDQEAGNFRGHAILRSAYGPWVIKLACMTYNAMKQERESMGLPTVTLNEDPDKDDIDAVQEALAEVRANNKNYLILPEGYSFEWVSIDSSAGDLLKTIEEADKAIADNVTAAFMSLGGSSQSGSFALASTQAGQYHLSILMFSKQIEDMFNIGSDGWSPIERIVRMNYGPDVGIPRLEARYLPTRNWHEAAKILIMGKQAGLITYDEGVEAQLREILQFDPLDKETARIDPTVQTPLSSGEEVKTGDGNDD